MGQGDGHLRQGGSFLLTQARLPDMLGQPSRHHHQHRLPGRQARLCEAGVYCAAKFAVLGFAKALREEVQHQGIRVHTLCPGLVQVPPPACLGIANRAGCRWRISPRPCSTPCARAPMSSSTDRHDGDLRERGEAMTGASAPCHLRQIRPADGG